MLYGVIEQQVIFTRYDLEGNLMPYKRGIRIDCVLATSRVASYSALDQLIASDHLM